MFLEYYSFSFIHSAILCSLVLVQEFSVVDAVWVTSYIIQKNDWNSTYVANFA